MNITLEDLLPADQQIRSIRLYESADSALNIMHEHRYGQLPVTGENEQFLDKVVTFESVLQAIQSFQAFPATLLSHPKSPKLSQAKDASEVRRLLERVRDVRNTLAHFRRELSPEERRTIQFAAGWLENNLPAEPVEAATTVPIT